MREDKHGSDLADRSAIKRRSKLTKCLFLLLVIAFAGVLLLLVDRVPPGADTSGRMMKAQLLIKEYVDRYERLPRDLEEMAAFAEKTRIEFKTDWTKDEWGNPIVYEKGPDNLVTLKSLGHDKSVGGKGRSADVTIRFQIKTDRTGHSEDQEIEPKLN